MKNLFSTLFDRQFSIKPFQKLNELFEHFSFVEKLILLTFTGLLAISCFFLLLAVNNSFLVEVPRSGGTLHEGIVESPKFINPLLAFSDTDRDMTTLVYSGLLKVTPSGVLVPDLAESYSVSDDGLVYTFVLKDNLYFHDNTKLTADDVVFTINMAQNTVLKSLRRANWDGVVVNKVDDKTITFTLLKPYAPFLQNATLGILPKHIWKDVTPEGFTFSPLNINPIGSGPYKVASVSKNKLTGAPESYIFTPFSKYTLGAPMISIETKFYNNEKELLDALASGAIDSANSITPKNAAFLKINGKLDDKKIETAPLPRTFAVFFNQNQNKALSYKEVRQALLILTDKKQIVSDVLEGFGTPVDGVLPPSLLPPSSTANQTADLSVQDRITQAQKLLTTNGWVWNTTTNQYEKKVKKDVIPLAFSLSTSDAPELKATADLLKADWAKAGITVDVKVFEAGELTANVIGPRRYDALLYGEVIDRGLDFYAFWHSSQRKDPGLNIALYTNSKADTLLENGRATTNEEDRLNTYIAFSKEIDNDIPAIFLYAPSFIYITPKNLQGVVLGEIPTPSERFLGVNTWYLETDNVWRIFARH